MELNCTQREESSDPAITCCANTLKYLAVLEPQGLFMSCTLSSCSLVTLSVRPSIRSSPPYTLSPGTSWTRASFPRAWSLISTGVNICSKQLIFECSDQWYAGLTSDGVWWVQPSEKHPLSLRFLAAGKKKNKKLSTLKNRRKIRFLHTFLKFLCLLQTRQPLLNTFARPKVKLDWTNRERQSHPVWHSGIHSQRLFTLLLDHQVHVVVLQDGDHLYLHGTPWSMRSTSHNDHWEKSWCTTGCPVTY